ncbi:MAG: hypothetical protein PVJ04_12750 [Gemmatimonadota bacterium]
MEARTRRRWVLGGGSAAVLALAVAMAVRSPLFAALTKSTAGFSPHAVDSRVRFEEGADDEAAGVATFLREAVAIIEAEQGRPFKKRFQVFVCASQTSFNEFLGLPPTAPIRGAVRLGKVFLAPSAFSWHGQDVHRESLLHELSHLHLRQYLGFRAFRGHVPSWFHEGLADLVSGAGGEGVPESDAISAIQSGRGLNPEASGHLWSLRRISDNGLGGPMFHRQCQMFLAYIRDRDPAAFQAFLEALLEEKELAGPFVTHFGLGTREMWEEFVASLQDGR